MIEDKEGATWSPALTSTIGKAATARQRQRTARTNSGSEKKGRITSGGDNVYQAVDGEDVEEVSCAVLCCAAQ